MHNEPHLLAVYLHLAQAAQRRNRPHVRGRLLVLAAVTAANLRLPDIAAYCRQEVLKHNPQHLLKRWTDVEDALLDDEFRQLLRPLRRRYGPERAEQMLNQLGISIAAERECYFDDAEYAAAILGMPAALTPDAEPDGATDDRAEQPPDDPPTDPPPPEETERP